MRILFLSEVDRRSGKVFHIFLHPGYTGRVSNVCLSVRPNFFVRPRRANTTTRKTLHWVININGIDSYGSTVPYNYTNLRLGAQFRRIPLISKINPVRRGVLHKKY